MTRQYAALATLLILVATPVAAQAVAVVAGPPAGYVVAIRKRIRTATPVDITVFVVDAEKTVATSYAGTIRFELGQASADIAQLPPTYTFTAADQGRHTFRGGLVANSEGAFQVIAKEETTATTPLMGSADVTAVGPLEPIIFRDANFRAVLSQPWRYNETERVTASGALPITYEKCWGPSGFQIDAATGKVTWTPQSAGVSEIICVRAINAHGYEDYTFDVDVLFNRGTVLPFAWMVARPETAIAGVDVYFDASQSSADPSATPLLYEWRFGDGTAAPLWIDPMITHQYGLAGGWNAEVRVRDAFGAYAAMRVPIRTVDGSNQLPPQATIRKEPTAAPNAFTFTCDCPVPVITTEWDFGDGQSSNSSLPISVTYGPGRYHPTLVVTAANGLSARDTIEVEVAGDAGTVPPFCDAWAAPVSAGPAPLTTYLQSSYSAGSAAITSVKWKVGDAVMAESDIRFDFPAGRHTATFVVTAADGLTCTTSVPVYSIAEPGKIPPTIVSVAPTNATCGTAWEYHAQALGSEPFTWEVRNGPEGMEPDATGTIRWVPDPRKPGLTRFDLVVKGAGGVEDVETIEFTVGHCDPVTLQTCGCGASGGVPAFLGAALLWLAVRVRRRRRD